MYEKNVQQNNYNIKLIPFQLKLPIDLDKKIDMDSSLRTLLKITERLAFLLFFIICHFSILTYYGKVLWREFYI